MVRNEAPARAKAAGERQLPNDLSLPRQSSTLLKGTVGSSRKRSMSSLRVLRRRRRLWPVRHGGRPPSLAAAVGWRCGKRRLVLVEREPLGDDDVMS
jgi:hypothetical protein